MSRIKKLSIVVPSFKQEKTILKNIKTLEKSISLMRIPYEIIIVIDGLVDNTHKKLKKINSRRIKIYSYEENIGKGFAVRYGMLKAKGDVIGFIDAGFDIEPEGISMLLNHMIWYNADIIVGSKLHPVSRIEYPFFRKILSWGYRTYTHTLFGFKVKDTQVGIKLFRRRVVRDVFPILLVKQFAFDIEILAVSYSLGYRRIYEAPIKLDFSGMSTIASKGFWNVILRMLWDTLAVYYRLNIIHYYTTINKQRKHKKNSAKWKKKKKRSH